MSDFINDEIYKSPWGEINADSAGKSGKLIKIPWDIPVIKGTGPVNPGPTVDD